MPIKTIQNPLKQLPQLGQSPWFDFIERGILKNGTLRELINDFGILGVTTNPTIFEKAISNSSFYDGQINELARQGKTPLEIYNELAICDVKEAADLFKGIYLASNRMDGYISIEVLPEYAHDAEKTVDYAREIFKKINRENILIKVPATKESPEAVAQLISEGINVNVTLIFSKRHYQKICQAYLEGLKRRIEIGQDISQVCSVASVFVSRIDSKVDLLLDKEKAFSLKGRAALANSQIIYQEFKEIFGDKNFKDFKGKGAKLQRVLWGSTGTKNPLYSDVKYVEGLILPFTINTLPPETVKAFADHGKPSLSPEDFTEAQEALRNIKSLGIDLDLICDEIQAAGVKAFQDSFDKLISAIQEKI